MSRFALTLAACLWSSTALAENAALLIENAAPSVLDRIRGADGVAGAVEPLREAGVDVLALRGAGGAELREGLGRFLGTLDAETEGVAVVLSGRFVSTTRETYLLPPDVEAETAAEVFAEGLPLSPLLAVLADFPGRAVLMLAEGGPETLEARFLDDGAGAIDLPQGVTLIRGAPDVIAALARRDLPRPGRALVARAREESLAVEGYAPRGFSFLTEVTVPAPNPEPEPESAPEPERETDAEAEARLWADARRRDTRDAYALYLAAFPEGPNAARAEARIEEIDGEPLREARLTEEALELNRDERAEIQRNLALLDYDTRGIDGIFGPGTRGAIEAWQEREGYEVTSYLTARQVARLDTQAEARAEELEREAAAREEERAREDRAYWRETGASGAEADLRAYLDRYPDGDYADVAEEELSRIEEAARADAAREDRAAWDRARQVGTAQAYREYLLEFPDGAFAGEAQRRLVEDDRDAGERAAEAQAQAQEAALNLSPMARRLAEAKLGSLDLGPGRVDGNFDADTRRAIRRYQNARGLQVTGYLDQPTVVRLLADSILPR
ncbi:peptidoglycan-binding protein [Roseivivax sp. GX 12232]|uniref:peptidoglycan-binding domain-containing protein n=1 Tax=Roseivivax sp. GX 12232 TaxID=2900547 RepID=UPI001E63FC18|nr:peptidoglycan-binding domain-containing protein [Roseivivax sp. GX 12232]MCE0506062.1 peptidoglycan-binding protein [Roseivivax sp. GX 12232]